jgi:hypothetical protein
MKKFFSFFVCLLFAVTLWASQDNQETNNLAAVSSTEIQSISKILEDLSAYEKSNAVIDIECKEENTAQADIIEETWNNGNYEEAIELLKNSPKLEDAALGIRWKESAKTSLRWAGDVRVGNLDSIMDIGFDVDNSNGNLFAALLYNYNDTYYRFTINMSSDTGKTWTETYLWTTNPNYEIDIDGVVYQGYFYLAYSYVDNTLGRIRRFSTSDGSADLTYGYVTVIDEGVDLREIALTSGADNPIPGNQQIHYFAIMENDSLKLYCNSDTSATSWYTFNPPVENASKGLDACCAVPNKLWASYIGTDDEVYCVGGWSSWTTYAFHETVTSLTTSVSAYGDTVMVLYTFPDPPNYNIRYRITSNNGDSWGAGNILYGSSDNSLVNDVTARGGDGFGAVYQTPGSSGQGVYRHRSYELAIWSTPVSFADNVPRAIVKPCIERIADGIYGILYVNWPEQTAWFDRSDWLTPDGLSLSPDGETIEFGDTLELTAYLEKDASGVEGEELTFAVITGDGSVDPTSGVTDGSGEVHTEFIAGSTEENVTVQAMWVSINRFDTLSATVDIEVVAGGIEEIPDISGISAAFGSGEILCEVAKEGEVTVKVYDKVGREAGILLDGKVKRGRYELSLKDLNLATDIYFVVMKGPETDTKIKVALIE